MGLRGTHCAEGVTLTIESIGATISLPPPDPLEKTAQPLRPTALQRLFRGRGTLHRHLRIPEADVDIGKHCVLVGRSCEDEFAARTARGGDGIGAGDGGQSGIKEPSDYGADTGEWVGYGTEKAKKLRC